MFEAIKHIDVDRKNSLPVADFTNRYMRTSTPVVFGDLSHRWGAYHHWSLAYLERGLGEQQVNLYSNKVALNRGNSFKPVMSMALSEYFELLNHEEDDLQIRDFDFLQSAPELADDFRYPRLGLHFKQWATRLNVGAAKSMENMHYRPDLDESFLCNFAGKQTVLLVRPEQAKYTYEPPTAFESVPTVDYSEEGGQKHPALNNINAYYAELEHGDVLYIPSEYRYSVYYQSVSIGLVLAAHPHSLFTRLRGLQNRLLTQPLDSAAHRVLGATWQRRKLRKAVRRSKR